MQTRRTFLSQVALLSAASALPAFNLRASDKTGARLPVVGEGEHTYECDHEWLQPPAGVVWGNTHGLCQDSQGNIYVAHTVHPSSMRAETVVVYDSTGRFVRAFGEEFRGGAHGLDVRREPEGEFLYHCDIVRCKLVKTTLTGEVVWARAYPLTDPAYAEKPIPYVPTNVAFAPNGDFYVSDGYGSNRVLWFSPQGEFLKEIGRGPGKGDEQFDNPHGLWVDTRGAEPTLVIADSGNTRMQIYTLDGRHLKSVKDEGKLRLPRHFHVQGEWMVCPDLDSQVCLIDRDYRVVVQLGDGQAINGKRFSRRTQARNEFTPGKFICPHDAIFLANGDILVSEWLPIGRITRLRRVTA